LLDKKILPILLSLVAFLLYGSALIALIPGVSPAGVSLAVGWLEKKILPIVLSLVAFWLYGSALIALIPGVSPAGVSWIGHAGGFAAGLLAAWAQSKERSDAI
jgi:membrane associated rhomboid family serine protease